MIRTQKTDPGRGRCSCVTRGMNIPPADRTDSIYFKTTAPQRRWIRQLVRATVFVNLTCVFTGYRFVICLSDPAVLVNNNIRIKHCFDVKKASSLLSGWLRHGGCKDALHLCKYTIHLIFTFDCFLKLEIVNQELES